MANNVWARIAGLASNLASANMPRNTEVHFDATTGGQERALSGDLVPNRDYFGLTINEINLSKGREFWSTYDPLVYVAVDFFYGKERITVPKLIGPAAIKNSLPDNALPHGFKLQDIRVAGPHPFRGDQVGVTIILYKIRHTDYAKRVLRFAETLSNAFGLPAEITTVTKIGGAVVDAMETLFDMGDSEPIAGHRVELNTSPLRGFQPQYIALISGEEASIETLKVSDGRLVRSAGERYTTKDYVLYNVWGSSCNGNEAGLSFSDLVPKIYECASAGDPDSWQRGKAILVTLYQKMLTSPDLTATDANRLFDSYKNQMLYLKQRAAEVTLMSVQSAASPRSLTPSEILNIDLNQRAKEFLALPG